MENKEKRFFAGYCESAGRGGDLYVVRKDNCWQLNAGVNACGHDPGFGVVYAVVDGSPESEQFEAFFQKTASVQNFIIRELGATQQTCDQVFEEIWNYIRQNAS